MPSKLSSVSRLIKDNLVVAFVLLAVLFVDLFVLYLLQEKVRGVKREIIIEKFIPQLDLASHEADKILNALKTA